MKKLLNITIIILALFSFTSCCTGKKSFLCKASFSTAGGMNFSNLSEDEDYAGNDNESKLGLQLGANALLPINQNLQLETGLGFATKGSKNSYGSDGEFDGESYSSEEKTNLSYLEAPILARYRFNNTGFNAYGGLQPALLMSAKQKRDDTGSASETIDVKDRFKGFDTSAVFGVGYEFKNGLIINAGYDLGLVNIAESNQFGNTSIKNRAFKLSLAYVFGK